MIEISTNADGGRRGWAIDDPVLRLRIWGTDAAFELPKGGGELVLGTAPECGIQLVDPTGWISRRHARLVHDGAVWSLHDLESTNGIRQDGERRLSFQLAPGVEIELGDLTLIAESERLVALRRLLARFLGWDRAFAPDIDRALRAVRDMAALRAALVLRGDGDLTALVRRLHRHALGDGRPFVVCEPGDDGAQAFARADAGTLCLLGAKLPRGVARIAAAAQAPGARVRIAICAPSALEASSVAMLFARTAHVEITPLARRRHELDRLISDFAADAVTRLGAPATGFREHDRTWLRALDLTSLDQLDEVTLRLVALRNWRLTGGAERLGISHVALSKWMRRRKIPT